MKRADTLQNTLCKDWVLKNVITELSRVRHVFGALHSDYTSSQTSQGYFSCDQKTRKKYRKTNKMKTEPWLGSAILLAVICAVPLAVWCSANPLWIVDGNFHAPLQLNQSCKMPFSYFVVTMAILPPKHVKEI